MAKSKSPSPSQNAPEDVLSSLEAILDEVAAERDARARLLSGMPAAAPNAKSKPAKAKTKAGKPAKPAAAPPAPEGAAAQIAALEAKLEKARTGLVNRDARIADLKAERDALRAEIEELRASRSWRITAPLRRLRG
ncbi:hypothetical protein [Jannaschia seohaensis]|uniref:Uncharacterized protein n=1 Tax=Jannaschia seohaensis TaxID=475081 RepID=A0A2Y9B5F4_9RHOB|nr:hypothetical protein [Jannaschia seohaensis]PWJ12940.1 hypothetical protein BCF38_11576 [Jannaschia seohaensis]SSA50748.1 hypothetical protein SAMN05421539_11576 [Jannaschia seohaensis]